MRGTLRLWIDVTVRKGVLVCVWDTDGSLQLLVLFLPFPSPGCFVFPAVLFALGARKLSFRTFCNGSTVT